jgi:glucose-6-phosphate 1-dehydrogenase
VAEAEPLQIVVVGASGDLARRKIVPALFSLFTQGLLPEPFQVFGFARSAMDDEAFRSLLRENLACRYVSRASCAGRMDAFLARCHYVAGQYGERDSFLGLFERMRDVSGPVGRRLFYLAIPPSLFAPVSDALAAAGLVTCVEDKPWTRVVVEKPFGRDRESSDMLAAELGHVFAESQTYRIDHYLGKEVVQNLMVLRFANLVFEPIWNRRHIRHVAIRWQEQAGVEGRGGYYDSYGVVRDVMQNHLLQILAIVAMEPPPSLDSHDIRNAKVRLLREVAPVTAADIALGQYEGYRRERGVAPGSTTPTFAAAALRVRNERWDGVPFFMSAGKAMDRRVTEVRVRFREVPDNLFCSRNRCPPANELVFRIQPDEAIQFTVVSKVPGLKFDFAARPLDMTYRTSFSETIPEAYESLLLDVLEGDRSLFIRGDELEAAWDVFTPVLRQADGGELGVEPYVSGGNGPSGAARLASGWGVPW